ncbi:MAG: chemotaxis protein [Clostridiales bacterium]|jgi:two-component system chemotaxis response regulator CheV|nr:chemotaxis protein [Clostridiales bacterium]
MAEKKKEILLESGTNEFEVMEFTIAGRRFGINVAKVIEIMGLGLYEITPMPNSNPFVEGVFKPREEIMTVINLGAYMGLAPSTNPEKDILIITSFNKMHTAFHVHTVEAIHRISWTDIEKPDPIIYGGEEGLATGIARFDNRLIMIIDFEKIIVDINPRTGIQLEEVDKLGARPISGKPVMIAEDSPLLERMLIEALEKSGYSNLICCSNGKEAYDKLTAFKEMGGPLESHVSCLITDIEMPQMDGHRLVKLVREDNYLKRLPVVIFSSLIDPEMMRKGEQIGATAQISKPEIGKLVGIVDQCIL